MRRFIGLLSFVLVISMLLSACSLYIPSSVIISPVDQREHLNTDQPELTAEPSIVIPSAEPTPLQTAIPTEPPVIEPPATELSTPEPTP
ncbi:MAG: hypothetical protein IKZ82_01645, partial [Clostridia bacterium]|nr:hypothetical protein [Clostridia bacterium]